MDCQFWKVRGLQFSLWDQFFCTCLTAAHWWGWLACWCDRLYLLIEKRGSWSIRELHCKVFNMRVRFSAALWALTIILTSWKLFYILVLQHHCWVFPICALPVLLHFTLHAAVEFLQMLLQPQMVLPLACNCEAKVQVFGGGEVELTACCSRRMCTTKWKLTACWERRLQEC